VSKGGRGVTPTPPLLIFQRGDHPPPHEPEQVGGTPSPLPARTSPRDHSWENAWYWYQAARRTKKESGPEGIRK